jgi:hypothetical protein
MRPASRGFVFTISGYATAALTAGIAAKVVSERLAMRT